MPKQATRQENIKAGLLFQIWPKNDTKPLFEGLEDECRRHARLKNIMLGTKHSKHTLEQVKE